MSALNEQPQIGEGPLQRVRIIELFRDLARKVNGLAAGRFAAKDNTATAAPTTGTWARGDFVFNSQPSEAGSGAHKYVIVGWICTVGGTPGTWLQSRTLTGN